MKDLNSLSIIGRLTKDCEVKEFANSSIINFSLANNRSVKEGGEWKEEASFFDVKYFVKSTGIAAYLKKGQQVAIQGSLVQEHWEKDGQKRYSIKIYASQVQLTSNEKKGSAKAAPTQKANIEEEAVSDFNPSRYEAMDDDEGPQFKEDFPF